MSIFARHAIKKYQLDPIQVSVILFRHIGILLCHKSNSRFNDTIDYDKRRSIQFLSYNGRNSDWIYKSECWRRKYCEYQFQYEWNFPLKPILSFQFLAELSVKDSKNDNEKTIELIDAIDFDV